MDRNEYCELEEFEVKLKWVIRFGAIKRAKLCLWVSKFHPEQLECHFVDGPDCENGTKQGSYNIVCKIRFDKTKETWAVRFPQLARADADEKVEAEVATIELIRKHTDIPVPEIKTWGLSHNNELGLGAFIISTWVEGTSVRDILRHPKRDDRLLRGDISIETIEHLWRQIARFMLQLSRIEFDHIGSCTTPPGRPLTLKSHHMLVSGGIERPYAPDKTFTSSVEYFEHIADHDMRQLTEQLNSTDNEKDARDKYLNWTVLRQLVPRFVQSDRGPFKLICDDFGPFNMIVDNLEDCNIIAVIDWEWSYAGPQELFWSPPIWLLGGHPADWDETFDDDRPRRYQKSLYIFIQVMEEEEKKVLHGSSGDNRQDTLPSALLRRKQQDGSMWFYHIMHESFNGPRSVAFRRLRQSVPDFWDLAAALTSREEIETFVNMKMEHRERYKRELAEHKLRHPKTELRTIPEEEIWEKRAEIERQNPGKHFPWMV